jgi:hypothetical protein
MPRRQLFAFVVLLLVGVAVPANADPQGYIEDELGVGYFYGTFDQSPNVTLLAGGTAEDFCEANPEDPFNGEPETAPLRVFLRTDGAVDLKVNDKDQPIHLYYTELDGPPWIEQVCAAYFEDGTAPQPFASGIADLKVRVSVVSENLVDVFNSVNGTATGTDGREYKVRAWADLIVEDGVPVGDPADFVGFQLTEIRR